MYLLARPQKVHTALGLWCWRLMPWYDHIELSARKVDLIYVVPDFGREPQESERLILGRCPYLM